MELKIGNIKLTVTPKEAKELKDQIEKQESDSSASNLPYDVSALRNLLNGLRIVTHDDYKYSLLFVDQYGVILFEYNYGLNELFISSLICKSELVKAIKDCFKIPHNKIYRFHFDNNINLK